MTNVATYQNISNNVSEDQRWLAYIVLPTGDFWHVRFNGPTEEIARSKAIALWTKETAKWERLGLNTTVHGDAAIMNDDGGPAYDVFDPICDDAKTVMNAVVVDPWTKEPVGRGHHFAGKVWMRHATDGLKRVALTEIALYEKNGYYRSGPRSK